MGNTIYDDEGNELTAYDIWGDSEVNIMTGHPLECECDECC